MNIVCQTTVAKFKYTKLQFIETEHNINFNKFCITNDLVPNYIVLKTNIKTVAARKALLVGQRVWLKEELKQLHKKKDILSRLLLQMHLDLVNNYGTTIFDNIVEKINDWIRPIVNKKKCVQMEKLNKLMEKKKVDIEVISCRHVFHPRVVNKTKIKFTEDEELLLQKGLKHNLHTNSKSKMVKTLLEIESSVQLLSADEQNYVRYEVVGKLNNKHNCNEKVNNNHTLNEKHIVKAIKDKLCKSKALVTKADKGNSVVIMNVDEYTDKVETFIDENGIVTLIKEPTKQYSTDINRAINKCNAIFSNEQKRHLKVIHPTVPKLRGLPKIHKVGSPIRPLVNFINAPSYKVAKALDKVLRNSIEFKAECSIRNSNQLVTAIRNVKIPTGTQLVSFDVTNLFTNVPVDETVRIVEQYLKDGKRLNDQETSEVITLLKIILDQNYFSFNDKFYHQPKGLAMGSPLSPILAEIYLDYTEHKSIMSDDNKFRENILYWYRYVDDVICLYKGNTRQIKLFSNFLNSLHPNLKFTYELESENTLNYLDLSITREEDKHTFNIYRKPTHTDMVIHERSNHPRSHKYASFYSMIYRLKNTPLKDDAFNEELNTIKYIAQQNGYNPRIVDNIIRKTDKNKGKTRNERAPKYTSMTYSREAERLAVHPLRKHGVTVAFKTDNSLQKHLHPKTISNIPDIEKTGVYKLKCGSCDSYYIGQTGRSFKTRYKEHISAIKKQPPNSNYAEHLLDKGHVFSKVEDIDILQVGEKSKLLNRFEELHIYTSLKDNPNLILNKQLNFTANPIYETVHSL